MLVHGKAQDPRVHGRGNLGGAGGLGPVAHNARVHRQSVDNGVGHILEQSLGILVPAVEPGNARPAAAAGADGPAVGGKPADFRLQMDGGQVADQHRPEHCLPVHPQLFGELHHRQASGEPLVAAAGDNHHRQAAAVHSGIRACGGHGLGPDLHIVPIGGQQHAANVGAVVPPQALFRNGGVVPHLPAEGFLHVGEAAFPGKLQNSLHRQHGFVRQALLRGGLGLHLF